MTDLVANFGMFALLAAFAIVLVAGTVKGVVGFGMPMITIAGLGSFLSAELAIAGLLLPTLFTNLYQAFRGGGALAFGSLLKYWRFNSVFAVTIIFTAQLVVLVPDRVLFVFLGAIVSGFGLAQALGWGIRFKPARRHRIEVSLGVASGITGGMSGVWGPPLIIFLTALNTPKVEQVRALGITFLLGAVILVGAHLKSGLLDVRTIPFSALLVLPSAIGMYFGYLIHDKLDQALFQRLTLIVLVIAGLNLLRRGLFG